MTGTASVAESPAAVPARGKVLAAKDDSMQAKRTRAHHTNSIAEAQAMFAAAPPCLAVGISGLCTNSAVLCTYPFDCRCADQEGHAAC